MNTINLTQGNDHRLRVEMTRWDEPLALSQSSDVRVYAVSGYNRKKQLVVHYSSHDEGVLEALWLSSLPAGSYGLEITGLLEGEGRWTMKAGGVIQVTPVTEKGGEKVEMTADSFDVKAVITVCVGTTGVTEELRQVIADMIEEEYNASERVRETNEADRQAAELLREQHEGQRQQNEQGRVEAEQAREQAEGLRQTTFETNEAKRQKDFDDNEALRAASFTEAEQQRQGTFTENEQQRNSDYQTAEHNRDTAYEQAEGQRQQTFDDDHNRAAEDHQTAADDHANEQQRIENEQQRVENERGRVSAEEQREATFATYQPQIDAKLDKVTEAQFNEIFN